VKFETLIKSLTPERYEVLKRAVELGKWPDTQNVHDVHGAGSSRMLTKEERETSLQILIAYDLAHKEEQDRIGYVHTEKKSECEHEDALQNPAVDRLIIKN
jgi:uncharacterized protein